MMYRLMERTKKIYHDMRNVSSSQKDTTCGIDPGCSLHNSMSVEP